MDPYKVLGISPNASDEEVKKAYRSLTKKYHPDLNQNDPNAEKKYAEINAAYDMITKGTTNSNYGGYQQQSYGGSYGTNYGYGWGGWSNWGEWKEPYRESKTERSEYTAAKNFIRNGMYKEAINALSGIPQGERDGKWYYLMAGANMYMGNKVSALENAKKACSLDPDNEDYRRLLEQLQSGRNFYDNYTIRYNQGLDPSRLCLTLCALNACLGPFCGANVICC